MMNIKPSATIRKNYNEISALCKTTKEPVFLTKNGEGDLVVMDIAPYSQRESMLKLREQLVAVEAGKKGFSIGELDEKMKKAITETADGQRG